MKATRIVLNVLVILYVAALLALIITGGYEFESLGVKITSTRLQPIMIGLIVATVLRLAIWVGLANSSLTVISVAAGLGLAEFTLRGLGDTPLVQPALTQIHRPSDIYGHELVPDTQGIGTLGERISINSLGMRDDAMNILDGGDRIAIVGDSFTFGMGVELEETFVKQLQTLLRRQNPEIEVLNYGVISYSLWHYLELLDRRVEEVQVNLVIVALFLDDIINPLPPEKVIAKNPFANWRPDDFHASYLWNMLRNFSTRLNAKYRHLWGYKYMRGIEERKHYIGGQRPEHPYYHAQTGQLPDATYLALDDAMERLARWSSTNLTPVLVAMIPDASQLHEPDRQDVNRRVAKILAAVDLPFLDLTSEFEAYADPRPLYLFPLDAHTSAEGHLLIANQLAAHELVRAAIGSDRSRRPANRKSL